MTQVLVIFLIEGYQKYISPYKGFRCAHAALYDRDSCSGVIKKIIEDHGLFGGYKRIRERLRACKAAFIKLSEEKDRKEKDQKKKPDGYNCCDPGCACEGINCNPIKGCDLPDVPDLPDLPCDCSLF